MQLTAQILIAAFQLTQREILDNEVSEEKRKERYKNRWQRMAELLNEHLEEHAEGRGNEERTV